MKIAYVKIRKDKDPVLIAYGEAAGVLMDISIRIPTIMINPIDDSDEALLDLYKGTSNHIIIRTGTHEDR